MLKKRITPFGYKVASIFVGMLALALFGKSAYAVTIPSNFFTVVDTGGANDVNSAQNDLTQMGRDDNDPTYYELFWSWDATDFTSQAGNACALFDINNNTNIDYAVCVQIENVPNGNTSVVKQSAVSPVVVSCGDDKPDTCTHPSAPIAFAPGDIQTGDLVSLAASPPANLVTNTDPFPDSNPDQNYPNDSTIRIKIKKTVLPANAALVNVCSYPSLGGTGNNNPFDCLVNPGGGFLNITKVAPDGTTRTFNFTVNPGAISKVVAGSGTTGGFAVPVGTNYSVAETVPTNWQLDSAACALENSTATGTKSGSTVSGITIQSGKITTCTFTDSLAGTAPVLAVIKTSDANHDGTFSDIETVPADVSYPYKVSYRLLITNNSGSAATITAIGDDKTNVASATSTHAPTCASLIGGSIGANASLTCFYDVTFANANTAQVINTATVTATNAFGTDVKSDTATVNFTFQSPHITLAKSATEANYDAKDDVINYTLVATNDGNVTLTNVSISDQKLGTLTCDQPVTLAPTQTLTCTGSYTIVQGDLDAGKVDNTASTTGTDPNNGTVTASASESVPAINSPHITLAKSATEANYDAKDDVIHYTLVATNDGSVTLTNVSISDQKLKPDPLTCAQPVTLAPTQTLTCTGSYTIVQGDLDAGKVDNTASTTGTDPNNGTVTASASKSVPALQSPHITLAKSASEANFDAKDDVIHYTLIATNDGNLTLTNVSISDPKLKPDPLTCAQPVTLAPTQTLTCTGSYTVNQADVDAGQVENTGSVSGIDPNQGSVTDSDSESVPALQSPHITLAKSASEANYDAAGDVITYTLVATNDGNVTLTDVIIADQKLGALICTQPVTLGPTLAPNQKLTCTGSYTVTQGDVDGGVVNNTANAFGNDPNQNSVTDEDTVTVPALQSPHISIVKTATQANFLAVGDVISYTLVATNDGNVTLTNVNISDPKLGTLTCPQLVDFPPNATLTCTGSYSVTQGDVDSGVVANTASVGGKDPNNETVTASDSETVPAAQAPHITIVKSATEANFAAVGNVIHYTLVATNDGNVTLTNVSISDPKLAPVPLTCTQPVTLAPNATLTCTGSYTIVQGDVNAGKVDNTASATGKDPHDKDITDSDTEGVPAINSPHISIVKTATQANFDAVGDVISYTLVATNDGSLTLTNVSISDLKLGPLTCTQPVTLAPTQTLTCTGIHIVTQADINAGKVDNTGTTTGTAPNENTVTDSDDKSVPAAQGPHISIVKSAAEANYIAAGNVIHYTLVATNDGNVTLTNVSISDPKLGALTCTQPVTLAPTQTLTCTGSYSVTQADVNAGEVENIGTTTGTDSNQRTVTDSDSESVPAGLAPHISIVKTATQTNYDAAGDVISYTLVATNDGNMALTNVSISDPKLGTLTCSQPVTLAPGQSLTCTGIYTVTQSDVDAGEVDNGGTAIGTDPKNEKVTDSDAESVPAAQAPQLLLVKTAAEETYKAVGDVIHYTYVLTNSGNVTLFGPVSVSDDKTQVTCPDTPTNLAPGQSITCTATYTINQADVDAESVKNVAFAKANDPKDDEVDSGKVDETVTLEIAPTALDETDQPKMKQFMYLPSVESKE